MSEGFEAALLFSQGLISAPEMVARMQVERQAQAEADRAAMEETWRQQDAHDAVRAERKKQRRVAARSPELGEVI